MISRDQPRPICQTQSQTRATGILPGKVTSSRPGYRLPIHPHRPFFAIAERCPSSGLDGRSRYPVWHKVFSCVLVASNNKESRRPLYYLLTDLIINEKRTILLVHHKIILQRWGL